MRKSSKEAEDKEIYRKFQNKQDGHDRGNHTGHFIFLAIFGPIIYPYDPMQFGTAKDVMAPPGPDAF